MEGFRERALVQTLLETLFENLVELLTTRLLEEIGDGPGILVRTTVECLEFELDFLATGFSLDIGNVLIFWTGNELESLVESFDDSFAILGGSLCRCTLTFGGGDHNRKFLDGEERKPPLKERRSNVCWRQGTKCLLGDRRASNAVLGEARPGGSRSEAVLLRHSQ
jgi:hypothetical protein